MAKDTLSVQLDSAVEDLKAAAINELQGQGKEIVDKAIQAVSEKVQKKFIDCISLNTLPTTKTPLL